MGRRAFCIPALISSCLACVLLLLCTISTPTTFHTSTPFDFVRANNLGNITDGTNNTANAARLLEGIKLGSWGYCTKGAVDQSYDFCSPNNHGYSVTLLRSNDTSQSAYSNTEIKASWTRGLVVVVVAFVAALIGFVLSFIPHLVVMLVASIVHFIAFLLALIAFIIQIVLFIYTRNRLNNVTSDASVMPGPGFYLTLISIPLLFFSALTVCCGWRKQKDDDYMPSSYTRKSAMTSTSANGADPDYDYSTGGDKIPMQSSRQRVLDAFKSDK